jgi:predicted nucleic acid-binding protein
MTGGIVLDASVAIAIARREPSASELVGILRASVERGERRLVPDDFWLELVNVLVRRHRLAPEGVVEALRDVDGLGVESVRIDRVLLLVSLDLATRAGLSAYDAAYLALAEVEDARLLSLDRQLIEAAGPRGISLASTGPRRLGEPRAAYGPQPIDWARFGPYLAELRVTTRRAAGTRDG